MNDQAACEHVYSYVGAYQGDQKINCAAPALICCRRCSLQRVIACNSSNVDSCDPCAKKYVGRVAQVARSGLKVGVKGLFLTLTAPGESQHFLPSGRACPCTPPADSPIDFAVWNETLGQRWNHFLKDLSRLSGQDFFTADGKRIQGLIYFKAVEAQKRGVLHLHVLLKHRLGRPLQIGLSLVRELAIKHGFGHSCDLQRLEPGHASYVAKYVGKSASDSRQLVKWRKQKLVRKNVVNRHTGEVVTMEVMKDISKPTYCTWTKSRLYGLSMGQIKRDQQHYLVTLQALPSWCDRVASRAWQALTIPKAPL